ncbi:MAG: hypothetical protein M3R72_05255 [Bacteroidota bacterium]|nr:hypothetical protein [Bacteroidota bacterium]
MVRASETPVGLPLRRSVQRSEQRLSFLNHKGTDNTKIYEDIFQKIGKNKLTHKPSNKK